MDCPKSSGGFICRSGDGTKSSGGFICRSGDGCDNLAAIKVVVPASSLNAEEPDISDGADLHFIEQLYRLREKELLSKTSDARSDVAKTSDARSDVEKTADTRSDVEKTSDARSDVGTLITAIEERSKKETGGVEKNIMVANAESVKPD